MTNPLEWCGDGETHDRGGGDMPSRGDGETQSRGTERCTTGEDGETHSRGGRGGEKHKKNIQTYTLAAFVYATNLFWQNSVKFQVVVINFTKIELQKLCVLL